MSDLHGCMERRKASRQCNFLQPRCVLSVRPLNCPTFFRSILFQNLKPTSIGKLNPKHSQTRNPKSFSPASNLSVDGMPGLHLSALPKRHSVRICSNQTHLLIHIFPETKMGSPNRKPSRVHRPCARTVQIIFCPLAKNHCSHQRCAKFGLLRQLPCLLIPPTISSNLKLGPKTAGAAANRDRP